MIEDKRKLIQGTPLTEDTPTEGWFTFLHHEGPPIEWSDDVLDRIEYIRRQKPAEELATRLRHIAYVDPSLILEADYEGERVRQEAWRVYQEAWRVYLEAGRVHQEACRVYDEARRVYLEARRPPENDLERIARSLIPDCAWDGESIFRQEEGRDERA